MATEKSRFVNDLLHQLAVYQANAAFEAEKTALETKSGEELRAVEAELEELEALSKLAAEPANFSQSPDGSANAVDGAAQAEGSGETDGKVRDSVEDPEASGAEKQLGEESAGGPSSSGEAGEDAAKEGGQEGAEELQSGRDAVEEKRRQLELALAAGDIKGAQAHLVEIYKQRMRYAEEEADRERMLQDQRTQQLLQERRRRLLEKKARLEAERQQALEELEKAKQEKLEKLQQELQQNLVDFSIEFEVEPHELDKLSRQLWTESHQRYQKQLRELEKRHAQDTESGYEAFLKEWESNHDGEVEVRLHSAGSSSCLHVDI